MNELLVFGIGNRLMMDDGIGVLVVEALRDRNKNSFIQYIVGETDINYCIGKLENKSNIVIIDAAKLDKKPGVVTVIPLEKLSVINGISLSIHEAHLLTEITLLNKNIQGSLIAIEPFEINYGIGLSSNLNTYFRCIVDEIGCIIDIHFNSIKNRQLEYPVSE